MINFTYQKYVIISIKITLISVFFRYFVDSKVLVRRVTIDTIHNVSENDITIKKGNNNVQDNEQQEANIIHLFREYMPFSGGTCRYAAFSRQTGL